MNFVPLAITYTCTDRTPPPSRPTTAIHDMQAAYTDASGHVIEGLEILGVQCAAIFRCQRAFYTYMMTEPSLKALVLRYLPDYRVVEAERLQTKIKEVRAKTAEKRAIGVEDPEFDIKLFDRRAKLATEKLESLLEDIVHLDGETIVARLVGDIRFRWNIAIRETERDARYGGRFSFVEERIHRLLDVIPSEQRKLFPLGTAWINCLKKRQGTHPHDFAALSTDEDVFRQLKSIWDTCRAEMPWGPQQLSQDIQEAVMYALRSKRASMY